MNRNTIMVYEAKQMPMPDPKLVNECIETVTIHEFGHLMGLPGEKNRQNVIENLGPHCTNACSMQQGIDLPENWISITAQRLRSSTYCEDCVTLLKDLHS